MENTMCGARADFQTAGLNGVFAHFCRRGQKWVAPERETSPCRLLKEMGPPEAGKGSAPRPQARNGLSCRRMQERKRPAPAGAERPFCPRKPQKKSCLAPQRETALSGAAASASTPVKNANARTA